MKTRMDTILRILVLLMGVVILAETQASTYDVVNRFKLTEDRMYTQDMLNPYGHNFVLDIKAMLNKDLPDFLDGIDEVDKAANTLTAAQAFLRQYDKTEQNLRVGLGIGIPLPTFHVSKVKIVPDFRVKAGLGLLMGIRTSTFTVAQALDYVGNDAIKTLIGACDFTGLAAGGDIIVFARDNGCITTAQAAPFLDQYFAPSDTTVPNISNYVKVDARVGLNFDYFYGKHWFGNLSLYGHGRIDYKLIVSDQSLAGKTDVGELPDDQNTTINLSTDLTFGYKNGKLKGFVSVEEIKLSEMSNNEAEGGKLIYGNDPLIRLHGSYEWRYSAFTLFPFAGVHKRSGYDLSDGLYVGTDLGAHVWKERLGVRVRLQADPEHITFAPKMKLWFLSFEYMLKAPIKGETDGVKPATVHSANLRLSF